MNVLQVLAVLVWYILLCPQTIVGSSLNLPQLAMAGLRSFGSSLSSGIDVDSNGYNGELNYYV